MIRPLVLTGLALMLVGCAVEQPRVRVQYHPVAYVFSTSEHCTATSCSGSGIFFVGDPDSDVMTADEFRTRMELEPGFKDRVSSFDFL